MIAPATSTAAAGSPPTAWNAWRRSAASTTARSATAGADPGSGPSPVSRARALRRPARCRPRCRHPAPPARSPRRSPGTGPVRHPAVWVLTGGEDHGLLATFPPGRRRDPGQPVPERPSRRGTQPPVRPAARRRRTAGQGERRPATVRPRRPASPSHRPWPPAHRPAAGTPDAGRTGPRRGPLRRVGRPARRRDRLPATHIRRPSDPGPPHGPRHRPLVRRCAAPARGPRGRRGRSPTPRARRHRTGHRRPPRPPVGRPVPGRSPGRPPTGRAVSAGRRGPPAAPSGGHPWPRRRRGSARQPASRRPHRRTSRAGSDDPRPAHRSSPRPGHRAPRAPPRRPPGPGASPSRTGAPGRGARAGRPHPGRRSSAPARPPRYLPAPCQHYRWLVVRRARVLVAVLLAGTACGVTGCAASITVPAGPYAADPLCAAVVLALPRDLDGMARVGTGSQATAAWGDPRDPVVLRCGVEPPAPTTDPCVTADDGTTAVDWVAVEGVPAADGTAAWTFTTYGRNPAVEVVPDRPGARGGPGGADAGVPVTSRIAGKEVHRERARARCRDRRRPVQRA